LRMNSSLSRIELDEKRERTGLAAVGASTGHARLQPDQGQCPGQVSPAPRRSELEIIGPNEQAAREMASPPSSPSGYSADTQRRNCIPNIEHVRDRVTFLSHVCVTYARISGTPSVVIYSILDSYSLAISFRQSRNSSTKTVVERRPRDRPLPSRQSENSRCLSSTAQPAEEPNSIYCRAAGLHCGLLSPACLDCSGSGRCASCQSLVQSHTIATVCDVVMEPRCAPHAQVRKRRWPNRPDEPTRFRRI